LATAARRIEIVPPTPRQHIDQPKQATMPPKSVNSKKAAAMEKKAANEVRLRICVVMNRSIGSID
jgi:hypothetical protein